MGLIRLRPIKWGLSMTCGPSYLGVTMPVAGVPVSDRAQQLAQIEKLLNSHALHGSESLCKLLRFLTNCAFEHPGISPKEYQIATEVFGRPKDFDPHLDSMVRVQVGRLRSKLAEYFASEGAEDPILVEMPKGNYALSFHVRPHEPSRNHASASHEAPAETANAGQPPRRWVAAVVVLSVVLAAFVAVATDRLLVRKSAEARTTSGLAAVPLAYRVFWKGFITGPQEPWIIFSNAAFVGRPDAGMRYYDSGRDSRARVLDYYTGVGEVLAVHALDKVFGQLHQEIRVKRGSLFSLDDAKNNDLIFIGSPSENLTLLELPSTQNFVFQKFTSGDSTERTTSGRLLRHCTKTWIGSIPFCADPGRHNNDRDAERRRVRLPAEFFGRAALAALRFEFRRAQTVRSSNPREGCPRSPCGLRT